MPTTITNRRNSIRVMKETVINPFLDRRKRYGEEAIHEIAAGARIAVFQWEENILGDERMFPQGYIQVTFGGKSFEVRRREFKELLMASSEEVEATSFREFVKLQEMDSGYYAVKALERLWENPNTRPLVEATMLDLLNSDGQDS